MEWKETEKIGQTRSPGGRSVGKLGRYQQKNWQKKKCSFKTDPRNKNQSSIFIRIGKHMIKPRWGVGGPPTWRGVHADANLLFSYSISQTTVR